MMTATHMRRRIGRWLAGLGFIALGTLAVGPGQTAQAQTAASCNVAGAKGTDGPIDYGAYCWINFSGYNAYQATHQNGQNFVVTLPGGATLTFKLRVNADNIAPAGVPTWQGAAFGNAAFLTIPGTPVLYHEDNGASTTVTLSNLDLSANGSPDLPFVFVAADGESTNNDEDLSFTTAGDAWQLVDSPGATDPGRTMPTLAGLGTATVKETGNSSGDTGSYVFTTDNSPGTVSATFHGSGLQGVLFGLKFHSIDLAVIKTYAGDNFAGGTGSYALDVTNTAYLNQQPPTDPQPVQVVDTLPTGITYTGFSGSGWSCSVSGQVVTCDLPNANLDTPANTTVHMPALTLNVSIDAGAATTLINHATVQDVTTGYVFDVNQGNNSFTHTLTLPVPSLTTSSKTVVDLNGGDTNPGDTLRYTITVKESNGVPANNVHVTDDMPAHVGNLAVINAAGGTDNSSSSGGANGTGLVDITGISLPANGSKTIIFDVTVNSGTAAGTSIDNTAKIDTPDISGSPDATPSAPQVIVSQSSMPAYGTKVLYVYADNTHAMTRTPQTDDDDVTIYEGNSRDFTLSPAVRRSLVITPGSTINVNLAMHTRDDGDWSHVRVALYKNGTTWIGTSSAQWFNNGYPTDNRAFTVTVPNGGAASLASGDTLVLRVSNLNDSNAWIHVHQLDRGNRSTVSFDTSTVINVDSVNIYAVPYSNAPNTTTKTAYGAGDTVYVRAVIGDPFGSYDVNHATITLVDPNGTAQVTNGAMTQVADSGTDTRTFEYAYTLPPGAASGSWTASVTGYEGTENSVTHTRNQTFVVGAPDLLVVKSATVVSDPIAGTSNPHAIPGATMAYHIQVSNNGGGSVDTNTLVVTDPIPANTKFVVGSVTFSDGATSSGLTLPVASIKYANDSPPTWAYTPVAGGDGSDPAVTNLKFNTQGTMAAKTGASAPSFTINFNVIIK